MQILIIGAGPQALFLVRELSRLNHQVTIVGRDSEIAMHSRYGNKLSVKDEEHLLQELKRLTEEKKNVKCFVASGFYLAFLLKHYPDFFNNFQVLPNKIDDLELLVKKTKAYELAKASDIKYPQSHVLKDIGKTIQWSEIQFPQIIKWNIDIYLFGKPGFKTTLVNNQEELKRLLSNLSEEEKEALIMQEYLGADLRNNLSYGAYVVQGKPKLDICVNEVRHFRSGVSSVVEEYHGEFAQEIEIKARRLLRKTNFTGFLDVEFKIYNGKIYLLEVNPRPFGFIRIMKLKYPDLMPFVMGEKSSSSRNPRHVKWINFLRDLVLILKDPRQIVHMLSVVFDFEHRTFDVWDINDPKPFFYQLKR